MGKHQDNVTFSAKEIRLIQAIAEANNLSEDMLVRVLINSVEFDEKIKDLKLNQEKWNNKEFFSVQDIQTLKEFLGECYENEMLDGGDDNNTLKDRARNHYLEKKDLFNGNNDDDLEGCIVKDELTGKKGNDRSYGQEGFDNIDEGKNHDIYGDNGVDTLDGGDGNDLIFGHTNASEIIAQLGEDYNIDDPDDPISGAIGEHNLETATITDAEGNAEEDTLIDIENLYGGEFGDQFTGDDRDNILVGRDSYDTVEGREGHDILRGDAGADILNGGEGLDRVYFGLANAGVTVDLNQGNATTINADTSELEEDELINIEHLDGSDFNDELTGNGQNNIIAGFAENDTLLGNGGNDLLVDREGADTFIFTSPNQDSDCIEDINTIEGNKVYISASDFGRNFTTDLLNADRLVIGIAAIDLDMSNIALSSLDFSEN